ncbi:MAG: molybdate ABC transporter substrate-binding protein [Prochlorococcaceae cyanobacterium]
MPWSRRRSGASLLLAATALILHGSGGRGGAPLTQRPAASQPLLVSAAVSLSNVLKAIGPDFAGSRRAASPQLNLAGSGTLQRQIEQGAPVDVFISAGARQMDALERAGLLLPGTRRNLIGNQLVLVVPAGRDGMLGFADLASPRVRRIAIGDSAVPAGDYARQVLRHFQLTGAVQPKLVPLPSVRAVAAAVASGSADAGLVYRSDASGVTNLRITATAPPASHSPILYSGAVIRRSRQPGLARAYLDALAGQPAQSALTRGGFAPLPAGH